MRAHPANVQMFRAAPDECPFKNSDCNPACQELAGNMVFGVGVRAYINANLGNIDCLPECADTDNWTEGHYALAAHYGEFIDIVLGTDTLLGTQIDELQILRLLKTYLSVDRLKSPPSEEGYILND